MTRHRRFPGLVRWVTTVPVLTGQEEERVTGLLRMVLVTLMVGGGLYGVFSIFSAETRSGVPTSLFLIALCIGALALARSGRVRLTSWLMAGVLWVLVTTIASFSGGVTTSAAFGLVAVTVLASSLLNSRVGAIFAGFSALAGLGMLVAELTGTLPPAILADAPVSNWISQLLYLLVVVGALNTWSHNFYGALERANRSEQALAEHNAVLKQERERQEAVVQSYVATMARVAEGDLAVRATVYAGEGTALEPLAVLGGQLNASIASLQAMILRTRAAAGDLDRAVSEILAATSQQVAGAAEQSATTTQTTTTVSEVKVIVGESVARAEELTVTAQRTVEVSQVGRQAVRASIESMERIRGQVETIATNSLSLSECTQQIGEIISAVNDLAAQSNMLALNAAIEAARAGEQGKGFGVVAQEVRQLASQSRQATQQVQAILDKIQRATNQTVMVTEKGMKGADEGVRLAGRAGDAIERLAQVITDSAQAAEQMAAGGRQQAAGIEQIAMAMQNIQQATAQGLVSTRQAEMSARDLHTLATRLGETVGQYQA